jgi:hypothetical protein
MLCTFRILDSAYNIWSKSVTDDPEKYVCVRVFARACVYLQ